MVTGRRREDASNGRGSEGSQRAKVWSTEAGLNLIWRTKGRARRRQTMVVAGLDPRCRLSGDWGLR